MKFKRGDKVIFEGDTYDFGYISNTGRAVIYEEGEQNLQDAIAVDPKELNPIKERVMSKKKQGRYERCEKDMRNAMERHVSYEKEIRTASGCFDHQGKLAEFLFILLRDYLPCGDVEEIMQKHVTGDMTQYTNGWLAQYACYLAGKLR